MRGFFAAFDADTGQFAWKFYTVPGDPSKGFENEAMKKAAATWPDGGGRWAAAGRSGTPWRTIPKPICSTSAPAMRDPGPRRRAVRSRKTSKDNLYAASILAVNPDNGSLKWYFQNVPGDEWDFDSVQQLLLADITVKGQPRKVLMQANKNGFYYVIDRVTGKFISGQPLVQVTWAKGLDEATGPPHRQSRSALRRGRRSRSQPGPGGAHNWSPMSFNPGTGLVYIPSTVTGSFNYSRSIRSSSSKPGAQNMGIPPFFGPNGLIVPDKNLDRSARPSGRNRRRASSAAR